MDTNTGSMIRTRTIVKFKYVISEDEDCTIYEFHSLYSTCLLCSHLITTHDWQTTDRTAVTTSD